MVILIPSFRHCRCWKDVTTPSAYPQQTYCECVVREFGVLLDKRKGATAAQVVSSWDSVRCPASFEHRQAAHKAGGEDPHFAAEGPSRIAICTRTQHNTSVRGKEVAKGRRRIASMGEQEAL
jgi:hypothetical protein